MKQIIFTLMRGSWTIDVSTKSLLADEEDRSFSASKPIFTVMSELTTKYNERNIAVLFEID